MPRTRTTDVNNGADELLVKLLADFSYEAAIKWLRRKFSSFDSSSQVDLPLGDTKNDRDYFTSIRRLGYVASLKADSKNDINTPLVVAAIEMRKDLSERTSRSVQFNCAKRILKDEVERGQHGLAGLPSQGLFFFYDQLGHFRISLVSGEVENRRFKFNEAKRQSFFVDPEAPNNIVKRRLNVAFNTFADVKEAFSVEKLTKEFYDSLFAWYQWAMEAKTGITFPNDTSKDDDDRLQLSEAMIRMITRLMFVWFIRQKGLVPKEIFDKVSLKNDIIKDFKYSSMEQDNYYRVILQNLFFATLNCQPEKRKFAKSFHGMSNEQGVKTCYRYSEELFSPDEFMKLMAPVPFLNCALFDCLDCKKKQDDNTENEILLDGFSTKRPKQAHVPNGLFFDDEKGLIKLFNLYEFTIDENNPDDSDVALDPELLGKVFENLLGAFNPETEETARKSTGSFYTPREIVDYMVEESLKNYLKSKLVTADDERLNDLFDRTKTIDGAAVKFDKQEVDVLLDALYNCKILDPACGSGAFPMGVLQCMVRLFSRLDPHNIRQREKLMERYREDSAEIDGLSESERKERAETLEKQLLEGQHYPDYARKLYLIENCIYGVDIQPIATQISKLRFFISLLCDQLRSSWDPQATNYGLLSLPNLEAKFVCANTLLSLPKVNGSELALSADGVKELREDLQNNRHRIFCARTAATKAKYKQRDVEIREAIKVTVTTHLHTPNQAAIDWYQNQIKKALAAREFVSQPKIELQEQIIGGDLFTEGEKQWVEVDVNAEKRNFFDSQISKARQIIAEEYNKSKIQSQGSSDIEKLAAMVAGWDPYDQNACSDFFDPEWMFNVKDGFDIVIGNPPYFRYQASHSGEIKAIANEQDLRIAQGGKLNAYKLFLAKAVNSLTASRGYTSFIFQNSFLGDKSAQLLRQHILTQRRIVKIDSFPERDNEKKRVFEAVKMSVCIVLIENHFDSDVFHFPLFVWDDKYKKTGFHVKFSPREIRNLSPNSFIIPCIPEEAKPVLLKIEPQKNIFIKCLEGELNVSVCKKYFTDIPSFPPIFKGASIQRYYYTDQMSQGKIEYLDEKRYLRECGRSEKAKHHNFARIAMQGISGVNDKIRLIMTIIPPGVYLANSCNYLLPPYGYDINYILGLLNSKLMNWYFKLSSTNSNVNGYEVDSLPLKLDKTFETKIIVLVQKILNAKAKNNKFIVDDLEQELNNHIYALYGLTPNEIAVVEGENVLSDPIGDAAEVTTKKARKSTKKSRRTDEEFLD